MLANIKKAAPELLPGCAKVFENPLGYLHDAENGDIKYKRTPRHNILTNYKKYSRYGKLKIHDSVLARLALPRDKRKQLGYDSKWYKMDDFKECFDVGADGAYSFKKCDAIEVVSNK